MLRIIKNNQGRINRSIKSLQAIIDQCHWLNPLLLIVSLIVFGGLISGCENQYATTNTQYANHQRLIATTYRTLNATNCHQRASMRSVIIADLRANRFVDLVAVRGSVIRAEGIDWLHVYPRLSHRPSCYIPMTNLVPVE